MNDLGGQVAVVTGGNGGIGPGHLPDDLVRRLVRGNAIEMLSLDLEP